MEQIYVWVAWVPPGLRCSAWCSHLFFSLLSFFWKVKNSLAVPSFENRATPKTIRAGGRRMCAENSQRAETLGRRRFSFPLSGFQKQRNSRENQGRTSPQATAAAAAATPHFPLSCSHSHTQPSKSDFMQPSMRHTSLVIQSCLLDMQWDRHHKEERTGACV